MRLTLAIGDTDVLTVELHWPWTKQPQQPDGPKLEASGGGQVERADTFGDPDTIVSFGFGRPES